MKTVSLLVNDMMNSPQLSRSNERGTSTHGFSPFGAGQLADAAANILGFNGQRRDPVSGSYHLGNGYRAYNPTLMRFNCPDNLSPFSAGGINPYVYCLGDPINRADPTGHISWQAGLGIGLGILGVIATAGAAALAISAAGGIGAALSAASVTSLVTGAAGLAADVTGIASGAVSDTNPELSATLGWMSMGAGLIGAGLGAIGAKSTKGAMNIKKPKPILKYKAFDITTIGLTPSWKKMRRIEVSNGYVNDFRGTGQPGIILHGDKEGRFAYFDGISHYSLFGKNKMANLVVSYSSDELATKLKNDFSLDLIGSDTPLHVVTCYARRFEAPLAKAFRRPIITYSSDTITTSGLYSLLGNSSSYMNGPMFRPVKPKVYIY